MAGIIISIGLGGGAGGTAYAQATATPTQTWAPASTCTNGLPNPAASNGTFIDSFGANWAVECGQDSTGTSYDQYEGTNGHGIYSCFRGCDNRPGCVAFSYYGGVTSANTGAGRCYYKLASGTYFSSTTVVSGNYQLYAGAYLISNGTASLPCPYYNQTTYTDSNGMAYQVYCGYSSSGGTTLSTTTSAGMAYCMTQCDSTTGCSSFQYTYTGSEPAEGSTNTDGSCILKSGTISSATSNPSVGLAVLIGPASASSQTASASSTSTSSISTSSISVSSTLASSSSTSVAACTGTLYPSTPACPGANATMFTDSCGSNYTVYCGFDSSPGAATSGNANSISACMQLCDNYSGCRAATLVGTACYLKTGFTSLTSSSGVIALVRSITPNPAFAVPPQSPCTNCSTGCGTALPSWLSPNGATTLVNFNNPSDGLLRNYTIHIPQFYDINHASPMIFAFPGNGDTAVNIESQTGMSDPYLNPYAIMIYVNGYGKGFESNPAWAPGGTYSYVDDLGFINALITNLTASYCVDTGRLFAVGHSNGGGFVNVLACDPGLSLKIAAFAANSGAFYTNFTTGNPLTIEPVNTPVQPLCSPGRNNVPMLEFHGTADTQILYMGDTTHNGRVLPWLQHWATDWSTRQGYSSTNYTTIPVSSVTEYQFGGLVGQLGIVTHYMLTGWTHTWAGYAEGAAIDASPIIMNFFYNWSNPNRTPQYAPALSSSSSSSISTSSVSSSAMSSSTTSTTSSSVSSTTTSQSSSSSSFSSTATSQSSSSSTSSSSSSQTSSSSASSSSSTQTSSSSSPSSSSSQTSSSSGSSSLSMSSSVSTTSSSILSSSSASSSIATSSQTSTTSSQTTSSSSSPSSSIDQATTTTTTTQSASSNSTSSSAASGSASCVSGSQLTDANGYTYIIGCNVDLSGGAYASEIFPNGDYTQCMTACDSRAECAGWTWTAYPYPQLGGNCYFKQAPESFVSGTVIGGILVSSGTLPTSTSSTASSTTSSALMTSASTTAASTSASVSSNPNPGTSSSTPPTSTSSPSSTSQTLGMMNTTSTTSSQASSSSGAVCQNNTVITDANMVMYTLYCDSDTSGTGGGAFTQQLFGSGDVTACENACDTTVGCGAFVYEPFANGGGACYMKHLPQSPVAGTSGAIAGIVISGSGSSSSASQTMSLSTLPTSSISSAVGQTSNSSTGSASSQPLTAATSATSMTSSSSSASPSPSTAGDGGPLCGSTYNDTSGNQYMILCDTDTTPGQFNSSTEPDFESCINACDSPMDQQCVAVTFLYPDGPCYFKSSYTGSSPRGNTLAAILLSVYNPGSVSSSSTSGQFSTSGETSASASNVQSSSTMPTSSNAMSTSAAESPTSTSNMGGQSGNDVSSLSSTSSLSSSSMPGSMTSGAASSLSSSMATSSAGMSSQSSSSGAQSSNLSQGGATSSAAMGASGTSSSASMAASGASSSTVVGGSGTSSNNAIGTGGTSSSTVAISTNANGGNSGISSTSSGMLSSSSMEAGASSSSGAQVQTTTATTESSVVGSSSQILISSTSTLPACPSQTCGSQPSATGAACADEYGNAFNVTCGTEYQGNVNMRETEPNIGSCLTLCDTTAGCVAVNYIGTECQLLDQVTGNNTAAGTVAAASRLADVSTVYTTPPASTSSNSPMTSGPASNGASPTASTGAAGGGSSGALGSSSNGMGYGTTIIEQSGGNSFTPPTSGTSGGGGPGPVSGSNSGIAGGGTMYITVVNGQSTYATMVAQSGATATGGPGEASNGATSTGGPDGGSNAPTSTGGAGGSGGPGLVSGGNSGIASGPSGATGSASINTNGNNGVGAPTTTGSGTSSTGPVCPDYNDQGYTDSQGSTYNIQCNTTFAGDVITSTNSTMKYKRQSGGLTVQECMSYCDQIPNCVAINLDCDGTCQVLGSVNHPIIGAHCGIGAKRIAGPTAPGGGKVVTVTVCAASTKSTTVFTTKTKTTCEANAQCTTKKSKWLEDRMAVR